jgi:hypothetical protein
LSRGCRVWVEQRGLVDQAAALLERHANREFRYVQEGPVLGKALRRGSADPRGLDAVLAYQGWHFDAGIVGKPVDQPAVPHVRVNLTDGPRLERMDDLGGRLDLEFLTGVQGRLRPLPLLEVLLAAADIFVVLREPMAAAPLCAYFL